MLALFMIEVVIVPMPSVSIWMTRVNLVIWLSRLKVILNLCNLRVHAHKPSVMLLPVAEKLLLMRKWLSPNAVSAAVRVNLSEVYLL
jgi:hypothetical protein